MKILKCEKVVETNFYITTDDEVWNYYRRSEGGSWEVLMGNSWEDVISQNEEDALENAFKQYLAS